MQIKNSKSSWDLSQFSLKGLENADSTLSSCSSIFSFEPSQENCDSSICNMSTQKYFESVNPVDGYIRTTGNQLGGPPMKQGLPPERSCHSTVGNEAKTGKPSQESLLEGCVAQLSNVLSPVDVNISRSPCQLPSNQPVNCDFDFSFDSPPFCNEISAAGNASIPGRAPTYLDFLPLQSPTISPDKVFTPTTAGHPYEASRSKLSPAEKLYNCKFCGKPYQNLASLKNHHQKHETGDVLVKRHKCPYCAHSNQYHRNLLKHIDAVHRQPNYSAATSPVNILAKNSDSRQKKPLLGSVSVVSESPGTLVGDPPLPSPTLIANDSDKSLSLAQPATLRKKQSIVELLCSNSPETQNFIDAHSFSPSADLRPPSVQSLVGTSIDRNRTVSDSARLLSLHIDSAERPGSAEAHQCITCGKAFRTKQKLTHHMDIHDTRKPHFCEVPGCERAFSTQKYLQNHLSDHHCKCNTIRCSAENCDYVCNRRLHMKRHMAGKHSNKKISNYTLSDHSQNFQAETTLDPQGSTANSEKSEPILVARTSTSSLPSLTVQVSFASSASPEIPEFEGSSHPSLLPNVFSPSAQNAEFHHQIPSSFPPNVRPHTQLYPLFDSAEPYLHASRNLPPMETSPCNASRFTSNYNKRAATFCGQPPDDSYPKRFRSPCTARPSSRPNDAAEFPRSSLPSSNRPKVSDIDLTFTELNAVLSRDLSEIADKVKNPGELQSPLGQRCEIVHTVPGDTSCRSPSLYGSADSGNGSMTSARSLGSSTCSASTFEACRRLENVSDPTGNLASLSCTSPTPFNCLISCYNSPSLGEKVPPLASSVPSAISGGHRQLSSRCGSATSSLGGYFQPKKQQNTRCSTLFEQDDLYQPTASREHACPISGYENQELMLSQSELSVRRPNAAQDLRQHDIERPNAFDPPDPGCFGHPPPHFFENPLPAEGYHPSTPTVFPHITTEEQRSYRLENYVAPFNPAPGQQTDFGLKSHFGTQSPYSSVYRPRSEFDTCDRNAVCSVEVGDDVANLETAVCYSSPFLPSSGLYGQPELNNYPTDHQMPCGPMCTACPRTIPEERFCTAPQPWSGSDSGQSADKCPPLRPYVDWNQPHYGPVQTSHAFYRESRPYMLQHSETGSFVGDQVHRKAIVRNANRPSTIAPLSSPQCVSSVVKPGFYAISTVSYCKGQPYFPGSPLPSKPAGGPTFAMDSRASPWLRNCQPSNVFMQTPGSYASPTRINPIVGGVHPSIENIACDGGSGHPPSRFPSYSGTPPLISCSAPVPSNDEYMNSESSACSKCMHQSVHSIDSGYPLSKPFPNFDAVRFAQTHSLANGRQETDVFN